MAKRGPTKGKKTSIVMKEDLWAWAKARAAQKKITLSAAMISLVESWKRGEVEVDGK